MTVSQHLHKSIPFHLRLYLWWRFFTFRSQTLPDWYFRALLKYAQKRDRKCSHFWRSIAAPYARQCRKCGLYTFREDEKGDFPEGMAEFFEQFTGRKPNE